MEKLKAELTTDLKYPGDYVIYNITVANDGTIDAILEKINFSMEKEDTVINYYYSVDDQTTWNKVTKNGENPYNEDLLANTTDEFQVKVEYDPTKTGTATKDQKSNKLTLNLDYAQKTGGAVVPSNRVIDMKGVEVQTVSENSGLYVDEYNSLNNIERYVYRGNNPDNYISFNNELWRILALESDGTLKIVKNSSSVTNKAFDSRGYRNNTTSTYCPSNLSGGGCNAWMKSDNFVNGNYSGSVIKDAELNTYLNSTYYDSINSEFRSLIQKGNFGVGPVASKNTNLSEQIQLENNLLWNGNIGLMTVSDILLANSNMNDCGSFKLNENNRSNCYETNFIFSLMTSGYETNSSWTISPYMNSNGSLFYVHFGGSISTKSGSDYTSVIPVLYLNPNITLSGTGTQDDPYTINS